MIVIPSRSHARGRNREGAKLTLGNISFLFFSHVILAFLMMRHPAISTLHALGTLAVGMTWAAFSRRTEKITYIGAYIIGAEVLWRMTDAQIFWEYGKYAMSLVFIIAIFRRGMRRPFFLLAYFLFLIPSVFLVLLNDLSFNEKRQLVSFNLSGPFTLLISGLFFSGLRLAPPQWHRLFLYAIAPIIGIGSIVGLKTFTAEELYFTSTASMVDTSGGYGPNQISAVLGLGAFLLFFILIDAKMKPTLKALFYALEFVLAVQCALTFSRGGLYCAAAAALVLAFFFGSERLLRKHLFMTLILLFVGAYYIALPRLMHFTGGAIAERFQETSLTGRESLFWDDMRTFRENPLMGVGPGMSKYHHSEQFEGAAAHTEFSRLAAEHGILGLLALLMLIIFAVDRFLKAGTSRSKGVILSFLTWSILYMSINAMRLAAPSFLLGLIAADTIHIKRMVQGLRGRGVNETKHQPAKRQPPDESGSV